MQSFKVRFRIYDLLFYLLLVFSFYYTRNILCRVMMVAFFGYTVMQMIVQKTKLQFPLFCFTFLAFILYGAGNVLMENVISISTARTMVVSLALNFMMIFAIVQYIYMAGNIPKILRVVELGIFSTAFVVVLLSLGTITQGRLGVGTEINSNVLAILCVYGFVLSMYLRKIGKISQLSNWARIIFYILVILLTGSRKGLLMVIVAMAVIRFTQDRKKLLKNILIWGGSVIAVYILIMNVEVLYNIIGIRIENMLVMFSEDGATNEGSLKERQGLVKIGMQYIREKPWTGYGYDCFKLISGRGPNGKISYGTVGFYSHNNYIELLFGGGIIALVLYYSGILYLLIKLFCEFRKDKSVLYLLAIIVSKLTIEYYYVSSYERVDAYILAIILGCVLVAGRGTKVSERKLNDGDYSQHTDCKGHNKGDVTDAFPCEANKKSC